MNYIKELFIKYKSFILYVFFGVVTTLVNIITYYICTRGMNLDTTPSTVIAWIIAVVVAYGTNKLWVFESKIRDIKRLVRELAYFFSCRILTGILDLGLMYVFVDILGVNDLIMKVVSNGLVIILNYIASKLFIFKNKE